ncbi:MAG: hypothetical protein KJ619_01290 [Candidatus Omnitrophica bacterium]|nr:hypothetical protein [Candidatus Omnitrophota bacterium]
MNISLANILFLLSILLLAIIPRNTKRFKVVFWIIFIINFAIRCYLISGSEQKSLQIDKLKKADEAKTQKIFELENKITATNKLAEPPSLLLLSKDIEKIEKGYVVQLAFKKTKDKPLGQLNFIVRLPQQGNAKILNFWPPVGESPAFESGEGSKRILNNGKIAQLIYTILGSGNPVVEIVVSEPTPLQFEGNYGISPFVINVE